MNTASALDRMASRFGSTWWQVPLFYSHEYALRFELGRGEHWIEMFESAMRRAKLIVDAALGDSEQAQLGVATWLGRKSMPSKQRKRMALAFAEYGLPQVEAFEIAVIPPRSKEQAYTWVGATMIPRDHVHRVLWPALSVDFRVFPSAHCDFYLASEDCDVLIHPYDDRGMDVVSTSRRESQDLYDEYSDWLLDCDRERMDQVFGD
ncbi:MAG: DUF3885 domain-containing protein [Planctomycetota bacterium]